MLQHTMIVGTTGSGKSFLENLLVRSCISHGASLVLIDPKRTELWDYAEDEHTDVYADMPGQYRQAVAHAYDQMMIRFASMKRNHQKVYQGAPLYVFVDEMGALMNDSRHRRQYGETLGDICMMGRAAKVFLVICTQVPTRRNLPNEIRDNMVNKVVLRLDDMSRAHLVLGTGSNSVVDPLPRYGEGYVKTPDMMQPQRMATDAMPDALGC